MFARKMFSARTSRRDKRSCPCGKSALGSRMGNRSPVACPICALIIGHFGSWRSGNIGWPEMPISADENELNLLVKTSCEESQITASPRTLYRPLLSSKAHDMRFMNLGAHPDISCRSLIRVLRHLLQITIAH